MEMIILSVFVYVCVFLFLVVAKLAGESMHSWWLITSMIYIPIISLMIVGFLHDMLRKLDET
jgi:hypothetical protein